MDITIKHDQDAQEFTVHLHGETAELSYALPRQDVIEFQHTYVPPAFQGRGVGSRLIEHGLNYARQEGLKVIASCHAVNTYLDKNPDYHHLRL